MLFELSIRNFAIIENATIRFSEGLNIISGETGSGKSLVSDAILAVMGGRLSKEDIRSGSDRLLVEAQFLDLSKELAAFILANGIELEEDGSLIISREYTDSGKSICRVNGRIVTLTFLKEVSALLIDLIGQHDHQKLMSSEKHMELLDSMGGDDLRKLIDEVSGLYEDIVDLESKENDFLASPEERARAIDLLSFQLSEVAEAKLYENEEEELKKRKLLMMNAEKISKSIGSAFNSIFDGNEGTCVRDTLAESIKTLTSVSDYDNEITTFTDPLNEVLAILDDIKYPMRNHRDEVQFDINDLNEVEKRLDIWSGMKRKYGKTFKDIMQFYVSAEKKRNELCDAEERLNALRKEKEKKIKKYKETAEKLSHLRKNIAASLRKKIEHELGRLNMKGANFEIEVAPDPERISEFGIDTVAFLLSANPGEPMKPLDKVASGGEISRVMLALKTSTHDALKTSTMLFDEIDSGIGGKTALLVGDKIKEVSKDTQVICITHLAQIASLNGDHIRVEKKQLEGRTVASIIKIEGTEKIKELARMLSGDDVSETSLRAAQTMIDSRN